MIRRADTQRVLVISASTIGAADRLLASATHLKPSACDANQASLTSTLVDKTGGIVHNTRHYARPRTIINATRVRAGRGIASRRGSQIGINRSLGSLPSMWLRPGSITAIRDGVE